LKTGFAAFVKAAATSRSAIEFGVFLRKQVLEKDYPPFISGGGALVSSPYFPLTLRLPPSDMYL